MGRLPRAVVAFLCGAVVGTTGCSGCFFSPAYGPPPDYGTDAVEDTIDADVMDEEVVDAEEEDAVAGAYGPPPDM
jgi:hypothetical protein